MKVLSIEIMSNSAGMLLLEGNKDTYTVTNLGKPLSIPKEETTIKNIIEFQTNFSMHLQNLDVDRVVLCEGGNDSKKMRVRMEFAVLSECEKQSVDYETYPTASCTRLINSNYKKDTSREFSTDLNKYNLPKYMSKALVAGWRFIE
jgi:hypothetical protein